MTVPGSTGNDQPGLRANSQTTAQRTKAAKDLLEVLFYERSVEPAPPPPSLDAIAQRLLTKLLGTLNNEPPQASQAAEAALALAALSLAEGRPLNLAGPESGDLNSHGRVTGDRATGDFLSNKILGVRDIPATKGAFQSSSFRGGFASLQVRDDGMRQFVAWQSSADRTLEEVRALATALVDALLSKASNLPVMPPLAAARFSFTAFRRARDRLLKTGSGGAFEQYLLAGLLNEEFSGSAAGLRVVTKNVGSSDRSSRSPGDVEVRQGQALRGAYEVTAAEWTAKIAQLGAAADQGLSEAVIVAPDVTGVPGDDLAREIDAEANRLGIDVAVLDLHALMDVAASRITRHGRASAFDFVYRCLASWHRRQPELATRLIGVLRELQLVAVDSEVQTPAEHESVDDVIYRVRELLVSRGAEGDPLTPEALRQLATAIEEQQAATDQDGIDEGRLDPNPS